MKKLPTLLISILITSTVFSSLFSAKTQALQTDENGITWYTVPELLAYKEEDDREEHELCGENLNCLRDLRANKLANNPKYMALASLEYRQFAITSINPRDNKIKIVFFSEDMREKNFGRAKRDTELRSLYIAWLDGMTEITTDFDRNKDKYFADEIPNVYTIYAHREETDGIGWFTEKDREFEIEVPATSDLKNNISKNIHYKMVAQYSNMSGYVGYTQCMRLVDNNSNVECVAMFSAERGLNYFASALPEIVADEPSVDEPEEPETPEPYIPEPDAPIINEPEPEVPEVPEKPEASEPADTPESDREEPPIDESSKSISEQAVVTDSKTDKITLTKSSMPKSPNTGSMSSLCNQKTVEFPWWLCIIIALGDMAVLWFFWPTPKSPKNPKKV